MTSASVRRCLLLAPPLASGFAGAFQSASPVEGGIIVPAEWKPWGETMSFDELEGQADAGATSEGSAILADASKSFLLGGDSTSDLAAVEGAAGPREATNQGESSGSGVTDSWVSIPDTGVTFSYATHCDMNAGCRHNGFKHGQPSTQEMHKNVMGSLRALRFCFSDVLITLDTPHVGHDKAGPEVPGNFTAHVVAPHHHDGSAMALYEAGLDSQLRAAAVSVAKEAAELLRDHCAGSAPTWKVSPVNYLAPETRSSTFAHYAIPEEEKARGHGVFEKMYVNTMALDQNFGVRGQYVYHVDAQWRVYRSNYSPSNPNFIEKAISLMRSDDRVYMASVVNTFNLNPQVNPTNKFATIPGSVHGSSPVERVKGMLQGWKPEAWLSKNHPLRGEAFSGKWSEGQSQETKKIALFKMNWKDWGGIVTRHQFLMDVNRFKGLFPLDEWDTAAEHMWASNMNSKKKDQAFQIYFNETVGVFAGPTDH